MIVFRRDENVAVEGSDLGAPFLGVGVSVVAHRRRHRLVQEGQVVVGNVDYFIRRVSPRLGNFESPFSYGIGSAVRAGGANDYPDFEHGDGFPNSGI